MPNKERLEGRGTGPQIVLPSAAYSHRNRERDDGDEYSGHPKAKHNTAVMAVISCSDQSDGGRHWTRTSDLLHVKYPRRSAVPASVGGVAKYTLLWRCAPAGGHGRNRGDASLGDLYALRSPLRRALLAVLRSRRLEPHPAHEAARRVIGVLLRADRVEGAGVSLQGVPLIQRPSANSTMPMRFPSGSLNQAALPTGTCAMPSTVCGAV